MIFLVVSLNFCQDKSVFNFYFTFRHHWISSSISLQWILANLLRLFCFVWDEDFSNDDPFFKQIFSLEKPEAKEFGPKFASFCVDFNTFLINFKIGAKLTKTVQKKFHALTFNTVRGHPQKIIFGNFGKRVKNVNLQLCKIFHWGESKKEVFKRGLFLWKNSGFIGAWLICKLLKIALITYKIAVPR